MAICVQAPFRWPYLPEIYSGANMSPSILSVPICHLVLFTVSVLALAFFPVSTCARAPLQCPYVPGHPSGAEVCPGTIPVLICERKPFRCNDLSGHPSGTHMCLDTILVPIFWCHSSAQMCPGTTYRQHIGTGIDLGQIWPPEGCLDTYGHRKGTRAQMEKGMVYGHISAP